MAVKLVKNVAGVNVNKYLIMDVKFVSNFKNNDVRLEIIGDPNNTNDYYVEFIDLNTNIVEYSSTIKVNHWSKMPSNIEKNWYIRVSCDNQIVYERRKDKKFNAVFIKFTTSSFVCIGIDFNLPCSEFNILMALP